MAAPWDQLKQESDDSYARFLTYRNCGIRRSMRKGYARYLRESDGFTGPTKKIQHVPEAWIQDARVYFWRERARAWDIRNLHAYGGRVAVLHVQAITMIAGKNVRAAARLNPGDHGWDDLCQSVETVAEYLTPEVLRGIQERGFEPVPSAATRGGDDGIG